MVFNNDNNSADVGIGYTKLLILFFCSNLWTLLLTTIPVVSNVQPSSYYAKHNGWYSGADVMRFIEPIGGLQFNFWIFFESGIFSGKRCFSRFAYIFVFVLGASLYVQGAALHSGSNMFKNCLEAVMEVHDDDLVRDLYIYMRTVWEHLVSHYIYAVGYSLMALSHFLAYKDHQIVLPGDKDLFLSARGVAMVFIAALPYGILIAAVAADFPSGSLVALIYTIFYGIIFIAGYLIYQWYCKEMQSQLTKQSSDRGGDPVLRSVVNSPASSQNPYDVYDANDPRDASDRAEASPPTPSGIAGILHRIYSIWCFSRYRPVAMYFLFSYTIGLALDVIWVIVVGGFKSRLSAGL
jgi:hypothetical protein